MKYLISVILILLLFTEGSQINKANLSKIDCNLLKELFAFVPVQKILDLEEKKINQVRIIVPDSISMDCLSYILIDNRHISFSRGSFEFLYNFNTGISREVVFQNYKEVPLKKNSYILELLFYEYGCKEVKVDIYSIEFLVKIDKENNYDVDLLNVGIVH